MPKAVILYSFKKGDPSPLLDNLSRLKFKRTDARRTVFSKEFSVNEVELDVGQLADIKEFITKKATIMISSPDRIWREAFKSAGLSPQEAIALAGLAMADAAPTTSSSSTDMDYDMEDAPAATSIKAQLAADSQSQDIVDDDFDVDALVSSLANAKIGGRRRKTRRGTKKSRRRYSRKTPSLG